MSTTSTDTALYNPRDDVLSTSLFLGSSIKSLSPSRSANSLLSNTYKQARDLFLTRRLVEAYTSVEPLVTVPTSSDDDSYNQDEPIYAPIARAAPKYRVKIWSLYLTMINAIHELGSEEGKAQFGSKEWKRITSKALDGSIWDEVVQIGYGGAEGRVDADVVINLATLLLAQSHSQTVTQQRLETYLSASDQSELDTDISSHADPYIRNNGLRDNKKHNDGTATPRDLALKTKILELYTLHVLPRNEEWEYAHDFIKMSNILDEDTRESFLNHLTSLNETDSGPESKHDEIPWTRNENVEQPLQDIEPRHEIENHANDSEVTLKSHPKSNHQRAESEHDYGIETPKAISSPMQVPSRPSVSRAPESKIAHSPPISSRKKPPSSPPSLYRRSATMLLNVQHLITSMTQSLSKNPMALLRLVFFALGLVVALSRQDVKKRVARGWIKLRETVGMGVKVSYI